MVDKVPSRLRQRPVTQEDLVYILNREVLPTLRETVSRLNELLILIKDQSPQVPVVPTDVGAAFNQATLNANFAALATKINAISAALGLE